MGVLELFEDSTAWDARYRLPLVPRYNNPWIYGAYAYKLMIDNRAPITELKLLNERFSFHFRHCQVTQGLINRWPDGTGGMTSHDELIGAAYISVTNARALYFYLKMMNGYYINKPNEVKRKQFFRHSMKRFPWVMAFIKLRAGFKPSVFEILYTMGHITIQAFLKGESGTCKIWLMRDVYVQNWFLKQACKFWVKVKRCRGESPEDWLSKEIKNEPVFYELAPNKI